MLAVPYFEKALYELPAEQLTPDAIAALADKIESEVCGGISATWLLHDCGKTATRLLHDCCKTATRLLHDCF